MPEANSLDITTAYVGEGAFPYIKAGILSANTIANGYITTLEGVKKALYLQKVDGGDIQAFACDFTAVEDDITLTEAVLTPTKLMRNIQLCKADFRDTWAATRTGNGFANDIVPAEFRQFLLLYLAEKVAEGIEANIWRGDFNSDTGATTGGTAVTNFNGILAKVVVGTASMGYDNTYVGPMTGDANATTGVITLLNELVANIPDSIQGDEDTVIYMSRKTLFLLHQALASIGVAGGYAPQASMPRPTEYMGFDLVVPSGFPNDTLLAGKTSNLYFGTDLTSDFNQATVVDMTKTDASDNVRLRMQFTGGTQIGFLGDLACIRRSA